MEVSGTPGLAPSPQSEAVTSELQELSLQPDPVPLQERKNGERSVGNHTDASSVAKLFVF